MWKEISLKVRFLIAKVGNETLDSPADDECDVGQMKDRLAAPSITQLTKDQ